MLLSCEQSVSKLFSLMIQGVHKLDLNLLVNRIFKLVGYFIWILCQVKELVAFQLRVKNELVGLASYQSLCVLIATIN